MSQSGALTGLIRRGGAPPLVLVLFPMLVAVLWLLMPAPLASAHAYLLASTPPDGYAVPTSPAEVSLDFDQAVTIAASPLTLTGTTGKPYQLGPATLSLGGRRLSTKVITRLADGGYRIHWQVTANDGDVVGGTVTFAVGTGFTVGVSDTRGASSLDSPIVIVARWMLFTGLALALGGVVGEQLARRILREVGAAGATRSPPAPPAAQPASQPTAPPALVVVGAGLGAAAAAVLSVDQVGVDLGRLITTGPGRLLGIELTAFAIAAALARATGRDAGRGPRRLVRLVGPPLLVVVLLVVVAAEGLRAHPHADSPIWGTALTVTHLLAVAVWVGALAHVLRVAHRWRGRAGWIRLLVYDYARIAVILVALVIITGSLEALLVLPNPASLIDTTYGLVLLAKITLVAGIVLFAVLARRRLWHSARAPATSPVGRAVRAEATGLVGVLAVTAVLVSAAPPGPATAELAAPPSPDGPLVPAGTLAGTITVIAAASAGQLVLRMTAPGRDDLGSDNTSSDNTSAEQTETRPANYQLAAQWSAPGAAPAPLTLRGCGAGCFTSPMTWRTGTNQLHLSIAAPPWPTGTATLDIPWPPRTDPTLLPNVLTAMRAIPRVTVHQAVTSDYHGYPGNETALPFAGPDFLATEPYSSGGGNPVILNRTPGEIELGLAFPSGIAIRLFVAPDYRILREEATTPNHLITSTFEYPPTHR